MESKKRREKKKIRKGVYTIMHNKHSFTAKWGKETGGREEQQEGKEIAKAQKKRCEKCGSRKKTRKISEQKRKKRRERRKK